MRVWCVRHTDGWCATYHGRRPDPEARSDATHCGRFVILRIGSGRRAPDCPDCLDCLEKIKHKARHAAN